METGVWSVEEISYHEKLSPKASISEVTLNELTDDD